MKLVVGLGNPGAKYANTRHNIGFIALDEWAYQNKQQFNKNQFNADYFETYVNNQKVLFVKPQTFMNLSGQAVQAFLHYYKVELEDLLIVYDDMDLEPGRVRMRKKGSAGGHNGMKSIIELTGSQAIQRLKIGVGRPKRGVSVINHVLMPFPKEDHQAMLDSVQRASDAISFWLEGNSFENTMTKYNN